MKASESKKLVSDLKQRGYVLINNVFHPPNSAEVLNYYNQTNIDKGKTSKSLKSLKIRSGWIDDHRNEKCLSKQDIFCMLIKKEFGLQVWPEFHAHQERKWRIDYAIPNLSDSTPLKIAIEVEGGIWTNGRHTRGKGFKADMEKYNYLTAAGWKLIRVVPDELLTNQTLELIKSQL